MDGGRSLLTFKGPVQPRAMKVREELETVVGDGTLLLQMLEELGFHVWFRYEKYREEFALEDVHRGDRRDAGRHVRRDRGRRSAASTATAQRARPRARPTTCSTRTAACSCAYCEQRGLPASDMLFDAD